ncbi:MAG: sulfatase-like hydrolase/transferase [Cocleimonas sp.]
MPFLKNTHVYAFVFTAIIVSFLSLTRFFSLLYFGDSHDIKNNISVLDDLFIVGLKFDLRIVGIVLLLFVYIPYLLLFWQKNKESTLRWVRFILSFMLACIVSLAFVDIGYFVFFGTPIDILIFGLLEDDTTAVIESGLSDSRLLVIGLIGLLTTVFIIWLYLRLCKSLISKTNSQFHLSNSYWPLLIIIPTLLIAARGSLGTFPLSQRQSSISNSSFINSLTQNAIFHLKYAYSYRKKNDFNKTPAQILSEAKVKDINELILKAGFNDSQPLLIQTPTNTLLEKKPPHVVFVLMEGWSSHIALNNSNKNPVLGRFKKHAEEDYFLPNFFSNKYGTNPSIESILLNSPITPLSQSKAYKTSFLLSNILPFKENNYKISFISGGYSSWRNHDAFWPKQGFDQYIDRSLIEQKYKVTSDNPWGVYDEYLFKYLQDDLIKSTQPSFSFILTTNNHPPVRLPPGHTPPDFSAKAFGFSDDDNDKETMLSAYHYQTDALGRFLDWLKSSSLKNDVIVVATGDHVLKGFNDYSSNQKQFLRYAVPAYFYIPKGYNPLVTRPKETINSLYGSHSDLFPTLFELSLSNTQYFSFGQTLMEKTKNNAYGWIDKKAFIVKQGVINLQTSKLHLWSNQDNTLLDNKGIALSTKQVNVIEQEKYRRHLKEWLLYNNSIETLTKSFLVGALRLRKQIQKESSNY